MLLLSHRPELYRHARDIHHEYGAYQLRAVLNAFGKDALPEKLYYSAAHKRRDWSLPWLIPHVLARHGIRARWRFWWRSSFKENALASLARDKPLCFVGAVRLPLLRKRVI